MLTYISVDLQCSDQLAQPEKYKRSFNKENVNSFKEKLNKSHGMILLAAAQLLIIVILTLLFNSFYDKFKMLFDESFPVRTISNKALKR